ncbi:MAG: hypothetical protein LBC96_06420 [Lachnospiraceae bacterium]|jgi:hypothetical protein|nr:hypothetical protein [Lachnospiraceae bacterium]
MTGIEIALLVGGAVIFIISFFLPGGRKSSKDDGTNSPTDLQAAKLIEREVEAAKDQIKEIIDETISYSMEKSERSMERVSNEKVMAINEYADTVLKDIHKNQQEAVFLYDMLNHKHTLLLETVSQANATAGTITASINVNKRNDSDTERVDELTDTVNEETIATAALAADSPAYSKWQPIKVEADSQRILATPTAKAKGSESGSKSKRKKAARRETELENSEAPLLNSNDIILEMHQEGKNDITIARTLGIGVSEVRLVIDLYEP